MRLDNGELSRHLKAELGHVYFIHGAEDLLIIESLEKLRVAAHENGYEDKSRFNISGRFNWDHVFSDMKTQSLFAEKKLIEIHIPNSRPGKQGSDALIRLLDDISEDHLLIVICGKLEKDIQRTKWVQSLSKEAVSIECKKIYPSQMPTWIKSRLRDRGLSIDREALEMFVALTEGNLFVAMQSIDRLGLMEVTNNVSMQDINDCVADGAHFDLFQLTDAAIMRKPSRVLRIYNRLQKEGMLPFELMRVVNWEIKNLSDLMVDIGDGIPINKAMKNARIWPSKQKIIGSFLQSTSPTQMDNILEQACEVDKVIKGINKGNPWDEIGQLLFMFSSEVSS